MGFFTEQMKQFTDHLAESIDTRKSALAEVRAGTEALLGDARAFLNHVTEEKRAMAHDLHATLATHHEKRVHQVAALRKHNQGELRKMREDLKRTLKSEVKALHKNVSELRQGARCSRHTLASDLREAAQVWRQFAG
jgi:DNA anti-recombination protein RmuC